tara:strand:- start:642 stop:2123 length:1482 start_codon:yes stop_codon:yes gene_type:complete
MKVHLFPVDKIHYEETIESKVRVEKIQSAVNDINILQRLTKDSYPVWGMTDTMINNTKFQKLSVGDICLNYRTGNFISAAKILAKFDSLEFGKDLWGLKEDKNIQEKRAYSNIIILDELMEMNKTLVEFNNIAKRPNGEPYKLKRLQQTISLSDESSENVIREFSLLSKKTNFRFNFNKKSKYSRHDVNKIATGSDEQPNFDMARTGYGKIDDNLFIFMNIGIPGTDGMDYKNHYDERTEAVSWCAKKGTHSEQPLMKEIINGELNLYLFARRKKDEDWEFLGNANVVTFQNDVVVADPQGNESFCMEYQLTCKSIEEDLSEEDIKSGELVLKNQKPSKKSRKNQKRSFKGRKSIDYLLKAKMDKKIGEYGEELVLKYEEKILEESGRSDLAKQLEHVSKTQGDGTGYDIKSFGSDGTDKFIEVKTTKKGKNEEFFMTPNEIDFMDSKCKNFYLYRVYNLKLKPFCADLTIYKPEDLDKLFDREPTGFVLKLK